MKCKEKPLERLKEQGRRKGKRTTREMGTTLRTRKKPEMKRGEIGIQS